MLSSYQDGLIAGLVKKGYNVGPSSGDGNIGIGTENQPSFLISLTLYKVNGQITAQSIYDDCMGILTAMKAYFYAIIVAQAYDSTWTGCNFNMPNKKTAAPPPLPPNKSNLN